MADEKTATVMRNFLGALETADVEKVVSFFADDGVWVTPDGTFRGKEQVRGYLRWLFHQAKDIKIFERGNGLMAQANKAFIEHVIAGTVNGASAEYLALCAWELREDKIKEMRTVYDRLSLAKQAARGWPAKWLVGLVVNQAEKGLH